MKNYPQSSVILCLTLDWLLAVSAHVSAREVLAKEEILKSVVAALQACSFNRTLVDDSCLIFANLSDIDEKETRHKLQRETGYQKKLLEYRNQYLNLDNKKQM